MLEMGRNILLFMLENWVREQSTQEEALYL